MLKLIEHPIFHWEQVMVGYEELPPYLKKYADTLKKDGFKCFKPKIDSIILNDKDFDISFNTNHDYLKATYEDPKTNTTIHFRLRDVSAYGWLGENKICDCGGFEIEAL